MQHARVIKALFLFRAFSRVGRSGRKHSASSPFVDFMSSGSFTRNLLLRAELCQSDREGISAGSRCRACPRRIFCCSVIRAVTHSLLRAINHCSCPGARPDREECMSSEGHWGEPVDERARAGPGAVHLRAELGRGRRRKRIHVLHGEQLTERRAARELRVLSRR